MKAAIYSRYSSELQKATSLEDQERLCRQECDRRGYTVTHTFSDAELSGQRDDRPGFQAMLAAAERREFDVLVLDDTARLSRDTADALHTLKRLQHWGVSLVSRDGIDTSNGARGSVLLYGMRAVLNEEATREIGARTWRGQQGAVERGLTPGGACYGYRNEPHGDGARWIIHEPEAAIVRQIFEWRVGDRDTRPLSLREIALRLNSRRVSPPGARWKGRTVRQCATWSFTAIRGIVLNPAYAGRVVWNRAQMVRHPDTRKRLRRGRPKGEWITRTDEALRIIDETLWTRAQARAAAVRLGAGIVDYRQRGRAKYLLSGFVLCTCGAHYIMHNKLSYRCGASRNRGPVACTNDTPIRRETLEAAIIPAIRDFLYAPASVGPLLAELRKEVVTQAAARRQRPGPDQALGALDAEITNIEAAVLKGKATSHLLEMLEAKVRERDALRAQPRPSKGADERLAALLDHLPEHVAAAVDDLHALMAVRDVDSAKDLLARLIDRIVLHPVAGGLEAEVFGTLQGVLKLKGPQASPGALVRYGGSGGRI